VFPAVNLSVSEKKILFSHRGASYGGLVFKDKLGIRQAFEYVKHICSFAKQNGFQGIDITLTPHCYMRKPNDYIEFALLKNGFLYRKREISSVIRLNFSKDQILKTFSSSAARNVRKAEKLGVRVEESDDFGSFYKILKRNLRLRHNVTPTHTLPELLKLKRMYPEQIRLFAAYKDQQMIAGVVIFTTSPRVVLAFYISHNDDFQRYRGVNGLFYHIIAWSIENNYPYLDFGIFTVAEDPNWGLARFKESFGAQGLFRSSLYLELS
jgi:lipid II:glycine glycyltransferase (peptidoglycan interpeptide bridge formation enzyme)